MEKVGIKFSDTGDFTNPDAITNAIRYIYAYPPQKPYYKHKTIYFYGLPYLGYQPSIDSLIKQLVNVRDLQNCTIPRQLWHFYLTFPIKFSSKFGSYFYFADRIAALFADAYPVCYAYHTKNKTTKSYHSHFHFVVSTSSYIQNYPPLDWDRMQYYLDIMPEIAKLYKLELHYLQSKEDLQCLNHMMTS